MTPDGAIRARFYWANTWPRPVELVTVSGHDSYWWERDAGLLGASTRPIAFTSMMTEELARLTVGVIGVSGTGSVVAEQVARLGFGHVCLIDFDKVERRNLNRILNATMKDVDERRLKAEMFADAACVAQGRRRCGACGGLGFDTRGGARRESMRWLFCCVDTLEARQVADLVAAAFLIPLIDVGVTIPVRKAGAGVAIADVCGRVDYVQPGRSTLGDRGVYTPESLRAEYLRKAAPDTHRQELKAGYIKGLIEEAPSVITLNMRAGASCVNEFIARAYPFRIEPNRPLCADDFQPRSVRGGVYGRGELLRFVEIHSEPGAVQPLLRACQPCGLRVRERHHEPGALVPQGEIGRGLRAVVICASWKAIACRPVCRGVILCSREMVTRTGASECAAPAVAGELLSCWLSPKPSLAGI